MNRQILNILIVLLLAVLGWLLFGWNPNDEMPMHLTESSQPQGGDFQLNNESGRFTLSDHRGKVVLLYFGYTMCPDVCPTSLAMMQGALREMSEEELTQVQGVFVSVDPERDSAGRLKEYTHYFHDHILGTTGSTEEIAQAAKRYGSRYRVVESDSATGYIVDHTSLTYVIDKQGVLQTILPHGTPPLGILQAVRPLLLDPQ